MINRLIFRSTVLAATVGVIGASAMTWPPLPKTGFVSGRATTTADVKAGNVVFVIQIGGRAVGKPLPLTIPEYVFWKDSNGKKVPMFLVQAEEANGQSVVGLRDFSGKEVAATLPEIQLLGRAPPK